MFARVALGLAASDVLGAVGGPGLGHHHAVDGLAADAVVATTQKPRQGGGSSPAQKQTVSHPPSRTCRQTPNHPGHQPASQTPNKTVAHARNLEQIARLVSRRQIVPQPHLQRSPRQRRKNNGDSLE